MSNYVYTKRDFLLLGVKAGSFNELIKKLKLDNVNYRIKQKNEHGRMIYYFNEEAYKTVADYLKNKKNTDNSTELMLVNANNELKIENQKLNNKIAALGVLMTNQENKHLKEMIEQQQKYNQEKEIKQREYEDLRDRYNQLEKEKNAEIERLKHRNLIKRILNLS